MTAAGGRGGPRSSVSRACPVSVLEQVLAVQTNPFAAASALLRHPVWQLTTFTLPAGAALSAEQQGSMEQ